MSEPVPWNRGARYGSCCEHGILLMDRCPECEREMYLEMVDQKLGLVSPAELPEDDPYE